MKGAGEDMNKVQYLVPIVVEQTSRGVRVIGHHCGCERYIISWDPKDAGTTAIAHPFSWKRDPERYFPLH